MEPVSQVADESSTEEQPRVFVATRASFARRMIAFYSDHDRFGLDTLPPF